MHRPLSPHLDTPGVQWLRVGALAVLGLLVAGLLQLAVAAELYPGGSWVDPRQVGHDLWANFLCDLGRTPAVNGRPNPGVSWGLRGQWTLALAAGAFWAAVPSLFLKQRLGRVVRFAGALSALGLILVTFTSNFAHLLALLTAAVPGLAAALIGVVGLRRRTGLAVLGALALTLSAVDLGLYIQHRGMLVPVAVPAVQRLALFAGAAWFAACAVAILRIRQPASS